MRERLIRLLVEVEAKRAMARCLGSATKVLVYRVLEDAIRLALDSEVITNND